MKLIGITGGIGMGKSTGEKFLQEAGYQTIDTDRIARDLVRAGEPALAEIRQAFGDSVIDADGALVRKRLAEIVFNDVAARARLESILHPRIRKTWLDQAERWRETGVPVVFVSIPLLFETKAETDLQLTVCVACSGATQLKRLTDRGLTPEQVRQRVASQLPVETKMARADYVVWTEGSIAAHQDQWKLLLTGLGV